MEVFGYVAAIMMGLTLGLIGGGGSILTVPILVYFFNQDALLATTGSLIVVGTTALVGAIISARRGLVDFKTGIGFAAPSFVGVLFVRRVVLPWLPDQIHLGGTVTLSKAVLVLIIFSILMIFASRAMIKSGSNSSLTVNPEEHFTSLSIGVKGFLVGCMTGFVGAGGGFLIVPALVIMLKMPIKIAVGTSLGIIAANSIFGFIVSPGARTVNGTLLFAITVLGVFGMLFGQKLSAKVPEQQLKKGFGYFVLVIGSLVLVDQIFKMF